MNILNIFRKKPTIEDRETDLMLHALEEGFYHYTYSGSKYHQKKYNLIESKKYGFIIMLHENVSTTVHYTTSFRMIEIFLNRKIHKKFSKFIKNSDPLFNVTSYPVDRTIPDAPKEEFLETLPDYLLYK